MKLIFHDADDLSESEIIISKATSSSVKQKAIKVPCDGSESKQKKRERESECLQKMRKGSWKAVMQKGSNNKSLHIASYLIIYSTPTCPGAAVPSEVSGGSLESLPSPLFSCEALMIYVFLDQ